MVKGQVAYLRFKKGLTLTVQEAIDAHCFTCNNREDTPCTGKGACTLFAYCPFQAQEDVEGQGKA